MRGIAIYVYGCLYLLTAGFSYPDPGESYAAAGVNYERLQEEVIAADNRVKEMTPMPSTATSAAGTAAATATSSNSDAGGGGSGGQGRSNLNRDDIMYFSL